MTEVDAALRATLGCRHDISHSSVEARIQIYGTAFIFHKWTDGSAGGIRDSIMKARKRMETVTVESIPIVVGREEDGRWWADIESMPGVMAYGITRDSAIAAVRALALRVAADCIEQGEAIPEPFTKILSVA